MDQNRVKELVDEAIAENASLFLLDLNFGPENSIKVVVDGDSGVPLSECIRISRNVEHNLDREAEDFSLEVTTPGATEPIVDLRQYKKNIGRTLMVKTAEGKFEGKLVEVNEKEISLNWKTREPKPVGNGKITVEKQQTIPLSEIKQAKVKIIF
jgi:ribosome maturation factor RimP